MINLLSGTVLSINEKMTTLLVGGVGFAVYIPKPEQLLLSENCTLYTYMHWNADRGPTLYGFTYELDRTVFLMIIDCQKIGPSFGLVLLSQMDAITFLEVVAEKNSKALSSLQGIGPKKAEQLITELCTKATKMLTEKGGVKGTSNTSSGRSSVLPEVSEALLSLGYSKQEISHVLSYLAQQAGESPSFDQLLRKGLAYLSQNKH